MHCRAAEDEGGGEGEVEAGIQVGVDRPTVFIYNKQAFRFMF